MPTPMQRNTTVESRDSGMVVTFDVAVGCGVRRSRSQQVGHLTLPLNVGSTQEGMQRIQDEPEPR